MNCRKSTISCCPMKCRNFSCNLLVLFFQKLKPEAVSESEKEGLRCCFCRITTGTASALSGGGLVMELAMMDEAIREFKEVIKEEPDLMLAHLFLGIAYAERGIFDEAMRELRPCRL